VVWCEQDSFSAVGYGLQDPTDKKSETTGQRMRVSGARVLCDHPPCSPAQAYAKLFGFGSPLAEGEFDSSATVCSGDSGGPVFLNGKIVAVTSFGARTGNPPDIDAALNSSFGELAGFTYVGFNSQFIYDTVPEPGTVFLMAGALWLLAGVRRKPGSDKTS